MRRKAYLALDWEGNPVMVYDKLDTARFIERDGERIATVEYEWADGRVADTDRTRTEMWQEARALLDEALQMAGHYETESVVASEALLAIALMLYARHAPSAEVER